MLQRDNVHSPSWMSRLRTTSEKGIVQDVGATFATRFALNVVAFFTSVLVARWLGPAGRGEYAVAAALGLIGVQLGNVGLHASNTYVVARDRSLLPGLFANSILVSFFLGGTIAVVCAGLFRIYPNAGPGNHPLQILALFWIPIGLCYLLLQNLLLGVLAVAPYNWIELLTKLLGMGLIVGAAALGKRDAALFFGAGLGMQLLGTCIAAARLWSFCASSILPSWKLFEQSLGIGVRAYLAAVFAFLVLRVDLLMVKHFLGSASAGYYSVAASLGDLFLSISVVVGTILFPRLAAMRNVQERWRLTRRWTLLVALGTFPIVVVFGIASPILIPRIFGTAYLPAASALIWLLPGIYNLGVQTVLVQFLNTLGYPKRVVTAWFVCCLANIGINLWAIPKWNIVGASVTSTVCYSGIFIYVCYAAARREKIANQMTLASAVATWE